MRRPRDERGNGVVEFVWLGILLLVPMVWIVLSVFDVQRGAFGISAAARSAARAYALAPDDGSGSVRAREAVRVAMADQGLDQPVDVRITCTPYPSDCHAGTSVITVRVASAVRLPWLPDALGGGAPTFALDATQTVPIGRFQEVPGATP